MPTQAHSQTLTITDNGIGLSQQEAIERLDIKECVLIGSFPLRI